MTAAIVPTIVAAAVAQARKRVIAALEERGAVTPDRAVALVPDRRMEQAQLAHLVRQGAVREVGAGRYWLDRAALERVRAAHIRVMWRVLGLAVGVAVVVTVAAVWVR